MVEDKMDIRGGYAKPKITDILWIQLVFLPWTLCKWVHFYTRYHLRLETKVANYNKNRDYIDYLPKIAFELEMSLGVNFIIINQKAYQIVVAKNI